MPPNAEYFVIIKQMSDLS